MRYRGQMNEVSIIWAGGRLNDGSADILADTDERNLMSAVPGLAGARGLSPSQVAIVRGHPSVRWPLAGREACAAAH